MRVELFVLGRRARDDLPDHPELIAFVVDAEIVLVAEPIDSGAQDTQAERVESRHRDFPGGGSGHHRREAFAHFGRGFVGKSNGEDLRRIDFLRDEVGDAGGDHARFSGTGAGEDEERTFRRRHGAALGVVEIEEAEADHGRGRVSWAGIDQLASAPQGSILVCSGAGQQLCRLSGVE